MKRLNRITNRPLDEIGVQLFSARLKLIECCTCDAEGIEINLADGEKCESCSMHRLPFFRSHEVNKLEWE